MDDAMTLCIINPVKNGLPLINSNILIYFSPFADKNASHIADFKSFS